MSPHLITSSTILWLADDSSIEPHLKRFPLLKTARVTAIDLHSNVNSCKNEIMYSKNASLALILVSRQVSMEILTIREVIIKWLKTVAMTTRQSTWGMGRIATVPPYSKVLVFCSLHVWTKKSNDMKEKFHRLTNMKVNRTHSINRLVTDGWFNSLLIILASFHYGASSLVLMLIVLMSVDLADYDCRVDPVTSLDYAASIVPLSNPLLMYVAM